MGEPAKSRSAAALSRYELLLPIETSSIDGATMLGGGPDGKATSESSIQMSEVLICFCASGFAQ